MVDLVGICPKGDWLGWLDEGDLAGAAWSGAEYGWYTRDKRARQAKPGDRFYIVAFGRLRGYAPVVRVADHGDSFVIIRAGDAVACTLADPVPGFRGLRRRWWKREAETPFPEWRAAGAGQLALALGEGGR
jgi:hypothetical protein